MYVPCVYSMSDHKIINVSARASYIWELQHIHTHTHTHSLTPKHTYKLLNLPSICKIVTVPHINCKITAVLYVFASKTAKKKVRVTFVWLCGNLNTLHQSIFYDKDGKEIFC